MRSYGMIFNAAASLSMSVNSSVFRADPAAENLVGYALREAATHGCSHESLAVLITLEVLDRQTTELDREFGEFMLL